MTHLITSQSERGINEVYNLPDRRLKELSLGIANLKEGDRFGETLNKREAVLIFLKGSVKLKGEGFDYGEISGKASCTSPESTAVYCPPGLFASKAVTDTQIAILRRWCDDKYKGEKSTLLTTEKMQTETLKGIIKHQVFENNNPASGFSVGEAIISEKAENVQDIILSDNIKNNKSEGLIYFYHEDDAPCGEFSIKSPLEKENATLASGQALIIPAKSDLTLSLEKNTYCVWIEGRIK